MSLAFFSATALAGFIYAVTPGPAFLAVFALAARDGRVAGGRFLLGHLAGDIVWGSLALAAIVGANEIGPLLFELLGLGCGLYLIYLGSRALLTQAGQPQSVIGGLKPVRAGLLFGLTNPKAYPVSLAVFTALTVRFADQMRWDNGPGLLSASVLGFLAGYVVILFWAGLPAVRRFFLAHGRTVTRLVGVTFILFGLKSIVDSTSSAIRRL